MKRVLCCIAVGFLGFSLLHAQQPAAASSDSGGGAAAQTGRPRVHTPADVEPFSRMALGGGIGINGVNLQAATNVNRYSNVRFIGNVFGYTVTGISSNGFNADGSLTLATMGASYDIFPFPMHGFRISPGLLIFNDNSLSAHATVNAGQSFTLNNVDYYSSAADPVRATARLGLAAHKQAFTMTTGWGNMISRRGGHWSFPVELGAAFVGAPTVNMTLAGTACDYQGVHCVNAATDPGVQSNLNAQIDKYRHDLDGLKVWPILSFGLSYNFDLKPQVR